MFKGKFLSVLVLLGAVLTVSACKKTDTSSSNSSDGIIQYTVTYYDGDVELKKETVDAGATATDWTPDKEGYDFLGWYATPTFSHDFKFADPITENKSAFAKFVSDVYVEDTRDFYLVGSGTSELLASSNWGKNITDDHKLSKAANKNEYTITMNIEVGDQFQFAIDTDWANQRGAGYMKDMTLDGTEYFKGSNSVYSKDTKKANMTAKVSGNYTFTLTTHPSDDYYDEADEYYTAETRERFNYSDVDTITWKRNGDVTVISKVTYDYYIKGSLVTGWGTLREDKYRMIKDNGVHTLEIQLASGDEFLFYSWTSEDKEGANYIRYSNVDAANSTAKIGYNAANYNMTTYANGTYTFVFTEATGKMVISYDETYTEVRDIPSIWYIAGNGTSPILKALAWGINTVDEAYRMTMVKDKEEYTFTLDLYAGDQFAFVTNSSWANKHSTLVEPGTNFTNGGNITVLNSGNYTFTLLLDAESAANDVLSVVRNGDVIEIPIETEYDVYIKGTMTEWAITNKVTTIDGIAEFEYTFEENDQFGFAYYEEGKSEGYGTWIGLGQLGTTGDANESFRGTSNLTCTIEGTYRIVVNVNDGTVDLFVVIEAVYDVYIKGTMTGWAIANKVTTVKEVADFEYTFAVNDEFGFAYYDEGSTEGFGTWMAAGKIGTAGDANSVFSGTNNFKCTVAGTYRVVIDIKIGSIDFYHI